MLAQDISPQAARHVLFEFGYDDGTSPGGFTTALLRAASLADSWNLAHLEAAFPSLIGAYRLAAYDIDGVERLRHHRRNRPRRHKGDNLMNGPLRLAVGSHDPETNAGCAMNVESWINGDAPITDYPRCADVYLAKAVQWVNDQICGDYTIDPVTGTAYLCPTCSIDMLALAARTRGTRLPDSTSHNSAEEVCDALNAVGAEMQPLTRPDLLTWGHRVVDEFERVTGVKGGRFDEAESRAAHAALTTGGAL